MIFTLLYMFVLLIFVSSIGGFVFYKLSYKFLLPKTLSSILGGVVTLLLGYQITMLFVVYSLLYGILIALALYIWFVAISSKN
ncbi:hypothetical protein [Virgibacillus halodenitrificans]|uniref:hypothetical protein n=1 Tax=Virgibacillus halodenitrificans TaxID=1482 RepID=UPI0002D4C550|nr:hypothetical protein [Virgibacillus halodenitrificans]